MRHKAFWHLSARTFREQVEVQRDSNRRHAQEGMVGFRSRVFAVKPRQHRHPLSVEVEVRRHGVSDLRRVKDLEAENAKLQWMYAELVLDSAAMRELITKSCKAGAEACRSLP